MESSLSEKNILFSCKFRALRKEKFASAQEAADAFGISHSHWSNWETAKRYPNNKSLTRILEFFGLSDPDYFAKEPETWEAKRSDFFLEMKGRSKGLKDIYEKAAMSAQPRQKTNAIPNSECDDFMEMLTHFNNAQKKVRAGLMTETEFNTKMQTLADMIELATHGLSNKNPAF